jgi:ribose transport system substrate-binding protein
MKLSRLFLFLVPAFVLGIVPACKKESGKPKVAIVTNNPELFWTYCEAGAREAAQKNDVELIFRRPESGEVKVQMDIVNALENQGVAGMAVSVLDPDNQAGPLKILSGKLKLLTMDNDAPGSDRICYVGTDNYAAGRMVGKLVREVMPQGGDLAIFVGEAAPLNARQRFWGVIDELDGRPARQQFPAPKDVEKVAGKYTLWQKGAVTDNSKRETCKDRVTEALAVIGDHPNVCMVGLWAYNPPAILEAMGAKYTQIKVVAFDEDDQTLLGIDSGRVYASVIQDPYQFGYKSVEILAAEVRGNTSKRINEAIPYRVLTKNGLNKDGKASESMFGVEIKYLNALEYRKFLGTLVNSTK